MDEAITLDFLKSRRIHIPAKRNRASAKMIQFRIFRKHSHAARKKIMSDEILECFGAMSPSSHPPREMPVIRFIPIGFDTPKLASACPDGGQRSVVAVSPRSGSFGNDGALPSRQMPRSLLRGFFTSFLPYSALGALRLGPFSPLTNDSSWN